MSTEPDEPEPKDDAPAPTSAETTAPTPEPAPLEVLADEELVVQELAEEPAPTHPGVARSAPRSISELHLKGVIESLVFASDKPMTPADLAKVTRAEAKDIRRLLGELHEEYKPRGIHLDEVAGGWQFRSSAANAPFVRELLQAKPVKLTRAQVETLAIVVYRQPVTRPEVDEIRGVDSGAALKILLERDLVRMMGRKEEAGRPVLYGTTPAFLHFFGLKSLRDLPTLREFTELTAESEAELTAKMMSGDLDRASPTAAAPTQGEGKSDTSAEREE
ncbi:MAG: SMC-Scp complex subunit ScpB [Myxococcales bacterium]|nr:SMC-Scp complex subunit ScpB [Myxococcales bacterium]